LPDFFNKIGHIQTFDNKNPGAFGRGFLRWRAAGSLRSNLARSDGLTLIQDLDDRWLPIAIEDGLVRPVGTYPERKVSCRCRKLVGFLLFAG
jgi:hypothetical protein